MNCSIKGTQSQNIINKSSRKVDPGYFDNKMFIDQFGEWRASKLSEEQLAKNVEDTRRFNEDGSPRLDLNKHGVLSYMNKFGNRVPIAFERFNTLPLDIRAGVSNNLMDAVVAELLLSNLNNNEDFLAGEAVEDFSLGEFFDKTIEDFKDWADLSEQARISAEESRDDYLEGITVKLKNLGVRIQNDAIKQLQSIERPTTDKASPVIQAIMQFVPATDPHGNFVLNPSIKEMPVYMHKSKVWATTLAHMADIPMQEGKNMVDVYLAKLKEMQVTYPWVADIHDTIMNGSDALKVQFVTAMNNVKNNVNITKYARKDGKNVLTTINATGAKTSLGKVISEWNTIISNTIEGLSEKDVKRIAFDVIPAAQEALDDIGKLDNLDDTGSRMIEVHAAVAPVFEALNIGIDEPITMAAFNAYTDGLYQGKEGEVDYLNSFKSFISLLSNDWLSTLSSRVVNETSSNREAFAKDFEDFAKGQVNIDDDSGVHMVTVGKNRIYVYSLPSVLQEQINEWKENPQIVKDLLNDSSVANSRFLKHFSNAANLAQLKVGMRGVITTTSSSGRVEAKDGKSISKGDYAKVDFYNVLRILGSDNKHVPIYNTQVPADKGKEFQLEAADLFADTGAVDQVTALEKATQLFVGYVTDEFNQMRTAESHISDVIDKQLSYIQSGFIREHFDSMPQEMSSAEALSWLAHEMPYLNPIEAYELIYFVKEVEQPLIMNYHLSKGGDLINLNPKSGKLGQYLGGAFNYSIATSINDINGLRSPVTNLPLPKDPIVLSSDKQIKEEISSRLARAISNKITKFSETAKEQYGIYVTQDSYGGISADIFEYYEKKNNERGGSRTDLSNNIMRDFVVNYMISKIEYSKLFTGDLSFYKSAADYIKRVPATYVDGLQPVTGIEEGDESFNIMTFESEIFRSLELSYDKNLSPEVRGHYAVVDRTDAQAYITPKRWRQILVSTGKFGPESRKVYNKIIKQGEFVEANKTIPEKYQLTAKDVKTLSAQPLKGVYFKQEIGRNPVYLKYSQAVLLPQFVANNPRAKQLLTYMESHGIDEMIADTGVKTGSKKPAPLFSGDEFVAPTSPELQVLDSRNWRLQQDLPTKLIKDNKIGVQVQKIIMSNLAFTGDTQLLQDIQNALGDLSDVGVDNFKKRYGIKEDGDSLVVTDTSKFYDALISDLESKESPENNIIDALKSNVPIGLIPSLKKQLQNQMFASLRKAATSLMTPGGAYIQISDQLIGKTEIERRGITMLVDSLDRLMPPSVREYKDSDGNTHRTVKPGQVLIPHSMIVKYLPNYQDMSPAELRSAIPRELREIIGYRIPTQAKASVDLLEVVGILPIELGDSIITYGEITRKTGSDFDIDKMFFMMREMEMTEDGRLISSPTYKTVEYKAQQPYMKDVVTEVEEELPIAGIRGVNKPEVNIEFLTNKELVDLDDAKSIIAHQKLQEDAKDLEDLINCIWA